MIIEQGQIFNLMDTNGRRKDVLNALKVYLEILEELKEKYPTESWSRYPQSLSQFLFYGRAIEKSSDVFTKHPKYDEFIASLGDDYQTFIDRDSEWIDGHLSEIARDLDEAIEKRARHYTSNLVKLGLTDSKRIISEAGYSFLKGSVRRDPIEDILPLDDVNILLFRQLSKLRVFSAPHDGKRSFYSPFIMSLVLLMGDEPIDEHTFEVIVQGLDPYCSGEVKEAVQNNSIRLAELEKVCSDIKSELPAELVGAEDINYNVFKNIFKSSKSSERTSRLYYGFYKALKKFRSDRTEANYSEIISLLDADTSNMLNKAFGYGRSIFKAGNRGSRFSLEKFTELNKDHPLISDGDFIGAFYNAYNTSKRVDGIREYSDTTVRLLSATGLFKFKSLPELSFKDILAEVFDSDELRGYIFGEMTEDEFEEYEDSEQCYFGRNTSLAEIFNFDSEKVQSIITRIQEVLHVSGADDVKRLLSNQKSAAFIEHITSKYPKERVAELLALVSERENDRNADKTVKEAVNDAATVPTIYEYLVGIAWYYISNREFDLYGSLNLTMNADFEPIFHAGGGEGDIIINYSDIVIMLEVTLMNKQAQKRGEWEPVLRHSLNLKALNEPKETITFFIADELDYNTINIWRAVAAVSLESTDTHKKVDGVVIMPFTNEELLKFLNQNLYYKNIVSAVKASFAKIPQITDVKWHEEIMEEILGK